VATSACRHVQAAHLHSDLILSLSRRMPASDPHGVLPGPVHADLATVQTALEQHITLRTIVRLRGRLVRIAVAQSPLRLLRLPARQTSEAIGGQLGNKLPRHVLSIASGVRATIAGSAAGGTRRCVTWCLRASSITSSRAESEIRECIDDDG